MEGYIPQDEYFEWEDILQSRSYDSSTFVEHTSYLSLSSQYRTSFSEKQGSPEIKDFRWHGCADEGRQKEGFPKRVLTVTQTSVSWDETSSEETSTNTMEIPTFHDMEYDTKEENASRSQSQPRDERAKDDTEILEEPSRNVDYLCHRWQERDIWATRKYVRSTMQEHENISRWENACWRSSAKLRLRLPPVCPLSFNWLRDQDDTWLYGPFCGTSTEIPAADSHELPVKSVLKHPCVSELLLRGSITTSYQKKQLSSQCPKQRTSIKFSEEVEQYCVVESNGSEWAGEDDECAWMTPRRKRSWTTVRRLGSTSLTSEPSSTKISQPPRIPLLRQEASIRSTSMLSEWMWLSGEEEEEDGDDIDWITAAADRTSAALKAASEPPPVFDRLAIKDANSTFQNFSGVQYPHPPSSSNEDDDVETEYLLACDHLEMESMTPDQSDYQSNSSSDDLEEEADNYFEKSGLLDRKQTLPKVGVVGETALAQYEQMMEEFNLILG